MDVKTAHNENKFSSLINLIKRESIDEIREVIHKWQSLLLMKDQSGRTALHYCTEHSSALCADLILEKCPNLLTAKDNDGYTPLILSVICGNQGMTRYLLSKGDVQYVNECDHERHSAVHWATVCGQLDCLQLLLSSGAHSSRADIHGAYPLHYSAQMCSPSSGICVGNDTSIGLTVLTRLLQSPDIDVDCVDSDGRTPLLWAASAGSADALLALINAGANVSAKDKDGLTALHCASSRGHIDCVETLLTLGADINQMDSNGCPPLFYAVTLGHADCTRLLIESGAEVNVQDYKGRTAAHCGAARGQFETIKILGQMGANLWLRNSRGDLPLHEAVKSGRKELVKWLLDQIPTAVNATNNYGRSPLHIAAINNNVEMCKILIDIGADVNTVMKLKGHFITPLDASLQKGYRGVAKYLLLHGAMPASRVSNSLNGKQRCPSGRPLETLLDNNSPIESYEEWKAREETGEPVIQSRNERASLPKLPTLVKNGSDDNHILETSSSTPSSSVENGNHFKNVRQFETPLSNKPSNLKQAIITNVYVTNTPICHSKRVPPLKKVKKRRKTIQESEELKALRIYTPSMSSSSSVINGEENVKVIMEIKDDSSFKLNDSSIDVPEEYSQAVKEDKVVTNDIADGKNIAQEVEVTKHKEVVEEVKESQNKSNLINENLQKHEDIQNDEIDGTIGSKSRDKKEEHDIEAHQNKNDNAEVISGASKDEKVDKESKKPIVDNKTNNSGKSSVDEKEKRSVSQRRGSMMNTKNIKTSDKVNERENTTNKKSDASSQKSRDESVDSKKERHKREVKLSESDKEKQKIKEQRIKARKEFSDKVSKFNKRDRSVESVSSQKKDQKKSSESNKTNGKQNGQDKSTKDVNSKTSVKSDGSSAKETISETNATFGSKSETKHEQGAKQIVEMDKTQKASNKDHLPANGKENKDSKGENEEYSDEFENDSEVTIIDCDSQSRKKSLLSLEEMESLKNSGPDSDELKSALIDKLQSDLVNETNELERDKVEKITVSSTNYAQSKQIKNKANGKPMNKNQSKVNSNNISNAKVKKQMDSKTSDSIKTKKETEKKANVREERSVDSNNNKTVETNCSKEVKDKTKANEKNKKLSSSLKDKSHLSVSDMSLNKTSEVKNELSSSPLRNSVSNQNIEQINNNNERPLTNLSSEESIFDSALMMADMDGRDTRMQSTNMHAKHNLLVSPLDRQGGVSPSRGQTEFCTEHCRTMHESRCGHKLHFKTMPAHLGKVDVTHVGSRVDSRRDQRYMETVHKEHVRRVRRVRPSSDGYRSIDPNIITQTVEKSLRKYQLERKLFEELHELKRFQIRSGKSNEVLMVKRLVDRFRREVKAPGMTDFSGPFSYKTYELYLYDQLRRLSWSNQGKVALLTRSFSHENISQELVVDINENMTQSSPEIMQSRDLDTNHLNGSQTHEINEKRITDESLQSNAIAINDNKTKSDNRLMSDMEMEEKVEIDATEELIRDNENADQEDNNIGNDRQLSNNFDNESQINATNSELLEHSVCQSDRETSRETDQSSDATHYQNKEQSDYNEDISHRDEPEFENLDQKSQSVDSQNSNSILKDDEETEITRQTSIKRYSVVEKIEEISDAIINEAIVEQTTIKLVQKTLSQTTLVSNESKATEISDAKSTIGSLRSENFGKRSCDSCYSRRSSSKSIKSTNIPIIDKRKHERRVHREKSHREKQIHRKECLKPAVDVRPLDSAINRKKFKRLRTRIPPKNNLNIPIEDIKSRWKEIKATEMKKVFLFSEHKQKELTDGFILWYELNKNYKNRNQSFDSQIDRYIEENRKSLHRTLSDSYLDRHKFIKI